jgi:hypothetical protein
MDDRALFWSSIQDYWNFKDPLRCPIKARHGLACFISHGCHYEVIFHVAQHWREAVRCGEGTLESPSRRIRELIMRSHEKHEQEPQSCPSNQSTINHFYVGQTQPQELRATQPATVAAATPRQLSPVPPELNTAASWESFWDHMKLAHSNWSIQLDRAYVALETDCWGLRLLFNSNERQLARAVEQGGLRIVILEELTKFIDQYKQQRRTSAPYVALIPSDSASSPYSASSASN